MPVVALATPLLRLLGKLELDRVGDGRFVGPSARGGGTLFGGFVAAQATVAAGRTTAGRTLHSLHGYFLRRGAHDTPIEYVVTSLRDGRTYSTRQVVARQQDEVIFTLMANFSEPAEGIEHQDPMPDAPTPESLPDWEEIRARILNEPVRSDGPLEVRVCDPESPDGPVVLPARRRVWIRPRGIIPAEPLLHAAMLVFASDRTLLRVAGRPHGLSWKLNIGASLDHAVWLHRPPRFDDWILFATESPVAHAGRPLLQGAMYRRDGTRLASVAQEGLIRSSR